MKKDNLTVVLAKFAGELNIRIDLQKIYNELLIHPDYPSLLAISDVLQNFGIDNGAYEVDKSELKNIPCPFIAHTNINKHDFILVHHLDDEWVTASNEKWNKYKVSAAEFALMYRGVVLTAEMQRGSTGALNKFSPARFKGLPVYAGMLLLAVAAFIFRFAYSYSFNWHIVLLLFAQTCGLAVSVLLLIQSVDSNNPLIQKICQTGGKTNCNDILSSKAAKVFEGLTWSEVGFFYFAGTWLFLLFSGASGAVLQTLAVLNILSLPYTVYSIYYQAFVAKKWCVLCCAVQALLWVGFIPLAAFLHLPFTGLNATEVNVLLLALLLPITMWLFSKPVFLQAQQLDPLRVQLQQFKYNSDMFNKTLAGQPQYASPDASWSIVLGKKNARHIITMVSGPFCPPCAEVHEQLHWLLEQNSDVQARIIFAVNNEDEQDARTPVSRHLMSLNGLADKSKVSAALNDWYKQKHKNYNTWAKNHPVELEIAEYVKIDKQKAWCTMAEITTTPTLFLNGYKLPGYYKLPDLKYMLQ